MDTTLPASMRKPTRLRSLIGKVSSLSPIAWAFRPAPTRADCIRYLLDKLEHELMENALEMIALKAKRQGYLEQLNYLEKDE